MRKKEEQKKRLTAAATTVVVNALVLLIMIFAAAWNTPGSGSGEYPGIEVNLGFDDQGSGNDQPDEPIGDENATDTENPPADPQQQMAAEADKTATTQDETETKAIEPATVTDPNSDVEIKEEKKEVKPVEKKPVEAEKTETPVKKEADKPTLDNNAVYKGKTTTNPVTTGDGDGRKGTTGNEGDDVNKPGDKGVEGGTEGAAIYKGKPGGGDGSALDIYGWDWDHIPKPDVPANETGGQVVFQIEVDANGDLIKYTKISSSVSTAAEKACAEALQKLTFTKKSGAKVPDVSKGQITFVIRNR